MSCCEHHFLECVVPEPQISQKVLQYNFYVEFPSWVTWVEGFSQSLRAFVYHPSSLTTNPRTSFR